MGKHFPLDLSKFKKIKEDSKSATLRHPDGHEITIAKGAVSAKLRGQLAELGTADTDKIEAKESPNPKLAESKKSLKEKPVKMADGGEPQASPSPDPLAPDPQKAKDFAAGASTHTPLSQGWKNMKESLGFDEGGQIPALPTPDQLAPFMPSPEEENASGLPPGPQRAGYIANKKFQAAQAKSGMADGGSINNAPKKTLGQTIGYPDTQPSPSPSPKNMSDGGEADASDSSDSSSSGDSSGDQPPVVVNVGTPGQAAASMSNAAVNPSAPQAPQAASPSQNAAQVGNAPQQMDPYGNEAYNKQYMQGLGEQKEGLKAEAAAQSAQGSLENTALQNANTVQQQMMDKYNKHYQDLQDEYNNVIHDAQTNQIDPNHYFSSMGLGQKIATGIGLIAGGAPAREWVQSQLQNDIQAQQANMGNRMNLLRANLQQFGNIKDAANMTYAMQQGIVANKMRQAAAQTSDQLAKSRLLQGAGQLDQQSAPIFAGIAMKRALTEGANQGVIPPETAIRLNPMVPESEKPAYYTELKDSQDAQSLKDNTLSAFDQVAQLNTLQNRLTSPLQTPRRIAEIQGQALDKLTKDTSGRVTPETVKLIGSIFSKMQDNPETIAIGRQRINDLLSQGMHYPRLKSIGINPGSSGRYNTQGKNRFNEGPPKLGQ